MRIEVIKSPRGRAIKAGEICPVDPKKKHWMCRIIGLDEKFGFKRDFLRRALYGDKGKSGGYAVDELKEGDIVEEADGGKNREYARIKKIDDSALEFEYMRASEVSAQFKSAKDRTRATA
jgi:hypothetical protein